MEFEAVEFKEQVQEAWGEPQDVIEAAMEEFIKHIKDAGLSLDDHEADVLRILKLVDETKNGDLAIFIDRLKDEILAPIGKAK